MARKGVYLRHRHTAMDMRAHILRLGRRSIVDIAANVAIELLGLDLSNRHDAGIAGHILPPAVDIDNLGHIFGPQEILRLALAIFAVGIDEQHVLANLGMFFVHHQNAGGDAGAIEQAGGQADHRIEPALLDEMFARVLFLAAAKQHAMGHHRRHAAVAFQHRQHVLDKHQIGLFALFGHHFTNRLWIPCPWHHSSG